jgi:hypothetical protein
LELACVAGTRSFGYRKLPDGKDLNTIQAARPCLLLCKISCTAFPMKGHRPNGKKHAKRDLGHAT